MLVQRAQAQEGSIASVLQGPRFSYEEYMRNLKMKLSINNPGAGDIAVSDFQLYIMREREAYLKSLNDISGIADPLTMSHIKPSFVAGSLQNSALGKRNVGLLNSHLGQQSTSSQGSLHFVSKNLSSSPDEMMH